MADPEVLKQTGLDVWQARANYAALTCAMLVGVFYFVGGVVIPSIAQAKYERDEKAAMLKDGRVNPLWMLSERKLTGSGFKKVPLDDGLVLFERQPPEAAEGLPLVEAVIRRKNQTVAVADVIALDDKASWEYRSSKDMRDGASTYSASEAVSRSNILQWVTMKADDGVDVVCVGLASRARPAEPQATPAAAPEFSTLAEERAVRLAQEFSSALKFLTVRPIQYWTLNLGNSLTAEDRDSPAEIRQRAAVVVVLSRRKTVDGGPVTAEAALALVTTNAKVYGTDLTNYRHSKNPGAVLKAWLAH